jgi:predicted nucleotidyltransferase
MVEEVRQHLEAVRASCRRHRVSRLDIFGSATSPNVFDPSRSDVDFVVRFLPNTVLGPWLAEYFALRDDLQKLLGRRVDLVMEGAIQSNLMRCEIDGTREVIYAAKDAEAA